jgi:hypothetical protein
MHTSLDETLRTVDKISLRVFLVLFLLLIPIIVLQPLLWRWIFEEAPPTASQDLGALTSIAVTLLTFALAGYGFAAWKLLRDLLTKELTSRLEAELQQQLAPALDSIHLAAAQIALNQSLEHWERYETNLWYRGHRYKPDIQSTDNFRLSVDLAIRGATTALEHADALSRRDTYEYLKLRYEVLNNLAYHLATRRDLDQRDRDTAFDLVNQLDDLVTPFTKLQLGAYRESPEGTEITLVDEDPPSDQVLFVNYNVYETVAWVFLRFAEVTPAFSPAKKQQAIGIVRSIVNHPDIDTEEREKFKLKYQTLFELELTNGP